MRNYPAVPVRPVTDVYFGTEVIDPYRYLEDKTAQETLDVVAAENAYTKAWFDGQETFSAAKREAELRAADAAKPRAISSIQEACGVRCASREVSGGLHEIVTLDDQMNVTGVVLNDAMLGDRMHVFSAEPCPAQAGIYAVMGVIHGHPRCCVVVWDAVQGKVLRELDGTFGYSWSLDGAAILYSDAELDRAADRNINRVRRYDWRKDELTTLYTHEENAVFIQTAPLEHGCLFQVLCTYDDILMLYWDAAEERVYRLNDGTGSCNYVGSQAGRCFFLTNRSAPMSRIISITAAQLKQEDSLLNGFAVALDEQDALLSAAGVMPDGILALHERDAANVMSLYAFDGEGAMSITLPDEFGHASCDAAMKLTDTGCVYLGFQSFTMEPSILRYDADTHEMTRFALGAETSTEDIAVEKCFFNARDGQRILCYLVRPKNLTPCGDTPVLMYGYGGYSASSNPWPEDMVTGQNIVEWVRKGRIYAHCIIRGGSEYGTSWHEAAMKDRKKNAFNDFIDTARHLVKAGWTKPEKIIATGLSNGGLLMTAVTTMAPEAFGIVVASVPHTDMLRFRTDDRGMMYVTEYGDPQESEDMFRYMVSYSPYHNIRPGQVYPSLYVQTGEMDNNVPPYHGKKFAVRMQKEADETNPVLLQVLAHGSHDRGVGDEYFQNIAQMQTFIEIELAKK